MVTDGTTTARDILSGIRVLECGEGIAVPFCGKLLGDFGAEVIKIEAPRHGDLTRYHGPYPGNRPHPERSGLFIALNTNKLGITLDVGTATGRDLFHALLHDADVLLHETPHGDLEVRGLTSEAIRTQHPRLIATSITPFGQNGPYRDLQSADIVLCALGGLSEGLGEPQRPPLTAPFSQTGYQAALSAASATLLALLGREGSGQGQSIDIGSADVLATLQTGVYLNNYLFDGIDSMRKARFGSQTIYPAHFFRCSDGFMWVTAPQWAQWERLLEMIGRPDLAADERLHNRYDMAEQPPPELEVPLAQWFGERCRDDIFALCRQHRLPITPVYSIAELIQHPQLCERGFITAVEHPGAEGLQLPGLPMQFSGTPWRLRLPAPMLGEHNAPIYSGRLGYAATDLADLYRAGVI